MFLQRLLWLLALFGLVWAVRRLFSAGGSRSRAEDRSAGVPPAVEGAMVRDRVCNTFLPRGRALTLGEGERQLYFCSERCRKLHLERKAS